MADKTEDNPRYSGLQGRFREILDAPSTYTWACDIERAVLSYDSVGEEIKERGKKILLCGGGGPALIAAPLLASALAVMTGPDEQDFIILNEQTIDASFEDATNGHAYLAFQTEDNAHILLIQGENDTFRVYSGSEGTNRGLIEWSLMEQEQALESVRQLYGNVLQAEALTEDEITSDLAPIFEQRRLSAISKLYEEDGATRRTSDIGTNDAIMDAEYEILSQAIKEAFEGIREGHYGVGVTEIADAKMQDAPETEQTQGPMMWKIGATLSLSVAGLLGGYAAFQTASILNGAASRTRRNKKKTPNPK